MNSFDERWQKLRQFVQICPVRAPDGSEPVRILTVRLDRALAVNYFAKHPDDRLPDMLILDRANAVIGTLGGAFPEDQSGGPLITFTDWRHGFPCRIDLYETGWSALPPHRVAPFVWNERTKRYENTFRP